MTIMEIITWPVQLPYAWGCQIIQKVLYGTVTMNGYNGYMIPLALAIALGLFIIGCIMWSVRVPVIGALFRTASVVPFISSFVIGLVPVAALGLSFVFLIISVVIAVLVGITSAF